MKFLCPSCKAKYQIADEKVIGREVKMKCRQCGHLIEINASVIASTGLSTRPPPAVSPPVPPPPAPPGSRKPVRRDHGEVEPQARRVPKPHVHARSRREVEPGAASSGAAEPPRPKHARAASSASTASKGVGPVLSPAKPPPPSSPLSSRSRLAPRPNFGPASDASTSNSAVGERPLGTPPSVAVAPRAPRKEEAEPVALGEDALETIEESPASALPDAFSGEDDEKTQMFTQGALAGAFTKAVETAAPDSKEHPLAGDEWYVGIGDVPTGPIRLTEIRDRAVAGDVDPDSLVWRDGFDDWRPLRTFPELLAIVEEAMATAIAGRVVLGAAIARPPQPAGVPAARAPGPAVSGSPPAVTSAAAAVSEAAAPVVPAKSAGLTADELALVGGLPRRRTPIAAWIAVAMALVLGVTLGSLIFSGSPAEPVVKYVEVPSKDTATTTGTDQAPATDPKAKPAEPDQPQQESTQHGTKRVAAGPSTATNGASSAAAPQGLKGLSALRGATAPGGPSGESNTSQSSGKPLDSASVQRTVSRYTASVKRSCWQPALDTRAPNASTTARVSVTINIAANGRVQSASTSGDPNGYRGLASCIASRVRNWEFPASSGPTTVNVPFVFAAQ